jgi:hypothetical protein
MDKISNFGFGHLTLFWVWELGFPLPERAQTPYERTVTFDEERNTYR